MVFKNKSSWAYLVAGLYVASGSNCKGSNTSVENLQDTESSVDLKKELVGMKANIDKLSAEIKTQNASISKHDISISDNKKSVNTLTDKVKNHLVYKTKDAADASISANELVEGDTILAGSTFYSVAKGQAGKLELREIIINSTPGSGTLFSTGKATPVGNTAKDSIFFNTQNGEFSISDGAGRWTKFFTVSENIGMSKAEAAVLKDLLKVAANDKDQKDKIGILAELAKKLQTVEAATRLALFANTIKADADAAALGGLTAKQIQDLLALLPAGGNGGQFEADEVTALKALVAADGLKTQIAQIDNLVLKGTTKIGDATASVDIKNHVLGAADLQTAVNNGNFNLKAATQIGGAGIKNHVLGAADLQTAVNGGTFNLNAATQIGGAGIKNHVLGADDLQTAVNGGTFNLNAATQIGGAGIKNHVLGHADFAAALTANDVVMNDNFIDQLAFHNVLGIIGNKLQISSSSKTLATLTLPVTTKVTDGINVTTTKLDADELAILHEVQGLIGAGKKFPTAKDYANHINASVLNHALFVYLGILTRKSDENIMGALNTLGLINDQQKFIGVVKTGQPLAHADTVTAINDLVADTIIANAAATGVGKVFIFETTDAATAAATNGIYLITAADTTGGKATAKKLKANGDLAVAVEISA